MKTKLMITAGIISASTLVGCGHGSKTADNASGGPVTATATAALGGTQEVTVIRYEYKPGEITEICNGEMKKTDDRIAEMLKIPPKDKSFANSIEAYEQITADLGENTNAPTFMSYVSLDKKIREESQACEASLGQYVVGLMSRRDIYDALVLAEKNSKKAKFTSEQKRLVEQTLKAFKRYGLFLPDDKLKEVKELRQKLSTLETKFASNLNENIDFAEMSLKDLEGVPESVINRFEKLPNGNYKVTTKSTDYVPFMENAFSSEARRRMAAKYENRAAETNTKLLEEAIALRQKIAKILKYENWADYQTEERMAKNSKRALTFLKSLRGKLAIKNKQDLAKLLKFKKERIPEATKLDAWDGTHYSYQLKKRDYSIDNEVIREFFPAERVVERMFDVYAKIFGVKFVPVPDAKVWAPHVKLYETRDARTGEFISHFFTDFVPREGKYGHAAAFTLVSGRMVDGKYHSPISSIVANFNPPSNGKPSLLTHDEVETLFHEFGHIMHQTLTKANYASLAGSSVARDFVEAPSQMLENWVWDEKILKSLSGHYLDPKKKLPDAQIKKLIAARDFNQGYFYTRQLLFGLFDMELHTSKKAIDPVGTYKRLYKELTTIDPLPETNFPAGFGHLMGGYDAGYYGYLWSEVFAFDMFTQFEKKGLLNQDVGVKYRKAILEKGDTAPADKLLVEFLGRKPNNAAFFKRLGIK
jgi:thimet oligopeptidase